MIEHLNDKIANNLQMFANEVALDGRDQHIIVHMFQRFGLLASRIPAVWMLTGLINLYA